MNRDYATLIEHLNASLTIVRAEWVKNKTKWDTRIDALLKERFKLMALRDAG